MSTFLDKVSAMVVDKDECSNGEITRAVGVCTSYGTPNLLDEQAVVQPDCKTPEGCLFCDKYRIHVDEQDARKLLSCRYCLRQTAALVGSVERLTVSLGPLFDRIQLIVDELTKRDFAMVEKVIYEVEEEGELDPYWARKLEMLIVLGVIL